MTLEDRVAKLEADVAKLQKKKSRAANGANEFIAAYCEAFHLRYGTSPIITKPAAGLAKTIVQSLGLDRANALVATYLLMDGQRYMKARHDLSTFWVCITDIGVTHDTGKALTEGDIKSADRRQGNVNAFSRYLGK